MTYHREAVFSYVATMINDAFEDIKVTSRREPVSKTFPLVYLHETNHTRPQQYATLANDDDQWESTFEAEVYTNYADGNMSEAYYITETIEEAFKKLGYIETFCQPIDNIDPLIVRIVSRYTRQIGSGDQIPES